MKGNSKMPNGVLMAIFYTFIRMDGSLSVRSHRVNLGEDGTPEKLVGVIVDMSD
jgi:hypothetical protein